MSKQLFLYRVNLDEKIIILIKTKINEHQIFCELIRINTIITDVLELCRINKNSVAKGDM